MEILNIEKKDDTSAGMSNETEDDKKMRLLNQVALDIVEKFSLPEGLFQKAENLVSRKSKNNASTAERVPFGFKQCPKTFAKNEAVRKRHRKSCIHKDVDNVVCETKPDNNENGLTTTDETTDHYRKFVYSCRLLREGLQDLAHVDAADEQDGQRAYELWKHDFVVFQATGLYVQLPEMQS